MTLTAPFIESASRTLGAVHHLGLVVRDCAEAAAFYQSVWGLTNVQFFRYDNAQSRIFGKPAQYALKIALGTLGTNARLELIEVISGNAIHNGIRERAGEGANHIAFVVENLDKAMATSREAGFDVALEPGPLRPNVAYLDMRESGGFFIELYERGFGH